MRIRCLALAVALTLALSAGVANAAVVLTFNDLTDATSVTVTGTAAVVQVSTEDFLVVLPAGTLTGQGNFNVVYGLTDGPTGFSDLVYFRSIPNSTGMTVEFVSDVAGPLTPDPAATLYGSTAETGLVQTVPNPAAVIALLVDGLTVRVQSDVESVPEPSILALAGAGGLLSLGVWGLRRRKS
jgi:hypothetical protein